MEKIGKPGNFEEVHFFFSVSAPDKPKFFILQLKFQFRSQDLISHSPCVYIHLIKMEFFERVFEKDLPNNQLNIHLKYIVIK